MEYIQGISTQVVLFFLSLGFGFLLGVLYDVFRTFRMIFSDAKGYVFVMDFLYFAVCGILSFFFMLVTDEGRLRLYTVSGEILGWMIYYFSFGTVAMKISVPVAALLRRIFLMPAKLLTFFFAKIKNIFSKISVFSTKKHEKNE